jgi:hypothetical protein
MKKIVTSILTLVIVFCAAQNANAKDVVRKKSACPNRSFEQFIEQVTDLQENLNKYVTGKFREEIYAYVKDDGFVEYRRLVQMINPKQLNFKLTKPGPDNSLVVSVSQRKINLFSYKYDYEESEGGGELLFERHNDCFRLVEFRGGPMITDRYPADKPYFPKPYFPKHVDPAVRYFLLFAPASLIEWEQLSEWPSKRVTYSRWGRESEETGLELVGGGAYKKPEELKKLKKFPFTYPMDEKRWQLVVTQESPVEVSLTFSEKLNEGKSIGRSISYYFTSSGGIMWLTEIVDKYGMLDLCTFC